MYTAEYFEERNMKDAVDEAGIARQRERRDIVTQFAEGGRLLDVGCGNGYFLEAARRAGFEVAGLDLSEWATRYVREVFGVNVATCDALDADFPPGCFDVVTLWHNLEHARDPVAVLRRVAEWLAPDGTVILRVPNFFSFDRLWHRDQWQRLSVPYHLVHFTPDTLRRALARAGLRPVWWDFRLPQFAVNALAARHRRKARRRAPVATSEPAAPTHAVQASHKARALKTFARLVPGSDMTVAAVRREKGDGSLGNTVQNRQDA